MTRRNTTPRFPDTYYAPYTFIIAAMDYVCRCYGIGVRYKRMGKRLVTTTLFHRFDINPNTECFTFYHCRDMAALEAREKLEALEKFTYGGIRINLKGEVIEYLQVRSGFVLRNALCRLVGKENAIIILEGESEEGSGTLSPTDQVIRLITFIWIQGKESGVSIQIGGNGHIVIVDAVLGATIHLFEATEYDQQEVSRLISYVAAFSGKTVEQLKNEMDDLFAKHPDLDYRDMDEETINEYAARIRADT